MNTTEIVRRYINKCVERQPILLEDIKIPPKYANARNVAVHRFEKEGKIRFYKNGIYYKPKVTIFGELGVDEEQIVEKLYLKDRKRTIGYVTGPRLWNFWGITTQVPNRVWIATNRAHRNKEIDNYNVKLIKPKVTVDENNYKILQFLDVIDQVDQIQDLDFDKFLDVMNSKLKTFDMQQIAFLIDYAQDYNKFVKNFTGALIENLFSRTKNYNEIRHFVNVLKINANTGKKTRFFTDINKMKNLKEWGFY
jgi:hypothetical protein